MKNNIYLRKMWVAFVDIGAANGYNFEDLIDYEARTNAPQFCGAIAYAVVKCDDIGSAIKLTYARFAEKNFVINEFFKIDNLYSLVKQNNARELDVKTVAWLNKSAYVFKISGKLWPYVE